MTVPDLERLLAYDAWANSEALGSLAAGGAPPEKALSLMAHVVGAGRLWLCRIRGETPTLPVWPALDLSRCRAELDALASDFRGLLGGLGPQGLSRPVAYVNSKGEPWSSAVGDILLHVVLHSAHHRGQIALLVRTGGHKPAYTDFIHCVRQGYLD